MRVLLLADGKSPHTLGWIEGLHARGVELSLFSLREPDSSVQRWIPAPFVRHGRKEGGLRGGAPRKLRYLSVVPAVKSLVRDFRPDMVHAHYATSYGLIGLASGFRPLVVSVWGSDVYLFPRRSMLHRSLLRTVLRRSDVVLSTSHDMARECGLYTKRAVLVTPFGVDTERFRPAADRAASRHGPLTVGTAKSLEPPYGIEYLLDAFARVIEMCPRAEVELRIAGDGSLRGDLEKRARRLGIEGRSTFLGQVAHAQMPEFYRSLDVFACLSLSESFGVSALEASATGLPVVASAVGGLPEVVEDGESGFLVPPRDAASAADRLAALVRDADLRRRCGLEGRRLVESRFSWSAATGIMLGVYTAVAGRGRVDR